MRIAPVLILAAAALSAIAVGPASAGPRDGRAAVMQGAPGGRILPLRAIEQRIVPQMRGFEYLGPEFYADIGRYRLKFLRGQRVVWIDVDARSGEVVGKSGF